MARTREPIQQLSDGRFRLVLYNVTNTKGKNPFVYLGRNRERAKKIEPLIRRVTLDLRDCEQAVEWANMLAKATAFRDSNIQDADDYAALQEAVKDGWVYVWWCGGKECEAQIKTDTKASSRCIPIEQPGGEGKCVVCGEKAEKKAYFARAY